MFCSDSTVARSTKHILTSTDPHVIMECNILQPGQYKQEISTFDIM